MKPTLRLIAIVVTTCLAIPAYGQQTPVPGPEHAKLKPLEGNWNLVLKMTDGAESKGTCEIKFECGGLWLTSDFKSDFDGQPFQGKGLDGYDPQKKKYVSVWVDSMTSYPMIFEGDFDNLANSLIMTAKAPGLDGKPAKWRSVTTIKDANHHIFEMFITGGDGQESKFMTVDYTRKKTGG